MSEPVNLQVAHIEVIKRIAALEAKVHALENPKPAATVADAAGAIGAKNG